MPSPAPNLASFGIAAPAGKRLNPRTRKRTGVYAPVELNPQVRSKLEPVDAPGKDGELKGRVFRVKDWDKWGMEQRLAFLREYVLDTARDPAIAELATDIIRKAGVKDRDYRAQWAALLKWVQHNITYVNEPNERLQGPQYTLTKRHGDCDDLAILLAALGYSIRLAFKFTISGRQRGTGEKKRWIEGVGPVPPNVDWAHIYLCAGWPCFEPTTWTFAEPTLKVPLGWDVVSAPRDKQGRAVLPEMGVPELSGADVSTKNGSASPSTSSSVASGSTSSGGLSDTVKNAGGKAAGFAKAIPWTFVAASVIGSVLSYTITRKLIEGDRRRR